MGSIRKKFDYFDNKNLDGVAYKNSLLKKQILLNFEKLPLTTISELSKQLNLSSPKIAELVNELILDGFIKDYGKGEFGVGRRPNMYGLKPNSIFFIGVDVRKHYINIGLLDFNKTLIKTKLKIPFILENTPESLDKLCGIVQNFTEELPSLVDQIVGIGVNLSGRINYKTGHSYSFFHFSEEPLSKVIQGKLGIPTYLENDSKAMAFGEFSNGVVTDEKNVLFINIDYGVGMGVMINGQLYYGKSGFAGEVGHIPIFDNEIICHCGKKGCLETEASGEALVRLFVQKLKEGASSIVTQKHPDLDSILLDTIVTAANNDDILAIECIAEIGEKLGQGIAVLINLYNPELIILGGTLSFAGDYLRLPVKTATNKYSIHLVYSDTELKMSKLGENAGIIGSCLLMRNRLLSLE